MSAIKKLRVIQLIAVIFLTISGGAYGLVGDEVTMKPRGKQQLV